MVAITGAENRASAEEPATPVTAERTEQETREQELARLLPELNEVWGKQSAELTARNAALKVRFDALKASLEGKGMSPSFQTLSKEWNAIVVEFRGHDDVAQTDLSVYYGIQKKQEALLIRWETWDRLKIAGAETDPEFHTRYGAVTAKRATLEYRHAQLLMTNAEGRMIGMYPYEKKRNPALTPDGYLHLLAKQLKTPEDLAMFQRYFMKYEYDSPEVDRLKKGSDAQYGEYWQTPEETMSRVEGNRMLGDCEDQAFFLQSVVKCWGKKVVALEMPHHITCVWVDKNEDGSFTGWDIGNHGLSCNGRRYGLTTGGIQICARYCTHPKAKEGFPSPLEALQSTLWKYRENPSLGPKLKDWSIDAGITISMPPVYQPDPSGQVVRTHVKWYLTPDRFAEYLVNAPPESAPPPPDDEAAPTSSASVQGAPMP